MAFVNYKNTNNASSLLISDITASATTILITDGDQNLFPSTFPFLLTLEHLDTNENVILREIVKVVSSNQNTFTVERSAGTCVQDDTATNRAQDNTAHAFYSGDRVSLYWTAEQVQDIQNNLELKANQDAIANVYDNTATYSVGDIVVYKGDRYVCSTAVSTPEDFDSTKWTKVNVQYDLNDKQSQIDTINQTISTLGAPPQVDVFVLGGGGGGGRGYGNTQHGGGGGAGGIKVILGTIVKSGVGIPVVIGTGGTGSAPGTTGGQNGGNSKFGNIVALGGGGGGAGGNSGACNTGKFGGNGGGGGGGASMFFGGRNYCPGGGADFGGHPGMTGGCCTGGGGGGAGGIIFTDNAYCDCYFNTYLRGYGGYGIETCFGGTLRCLGGGGNGGGLYTNGSISENKDCVFAQLIGICYGGGKGGLCGGGSCGTAGLSNTGGGGGGGAGNNCRGGNGGSGLVIVRYPTDCSYGIKTATGGTITTATIDGIEYKVHTFTSGGTFCITESV